jgi:EAL domain-containing protein (putative c-di-GMP-specific phosphodiesterase class I)
MARCNELGVSFAIDDFGIGYGAVNSLRSLPVRSIKIDRSFIHNMLEDDDDLATVQSVIGLAAAFHREVIAEGVETPGHRQALLKLGCHQIQGHGIARPMPARMQLLVWMPPTARPASKSQPAVCPAPVPISCDHSRRGPLRQPALPQQLHTQPWNS